MREKKSGFGARRGKRLFLPRGRGEEKEKTLDEGLLLHVGE